MAHIFGDYLGILPTKHLKENSLPHNPTDPNRYDGRDDLISCSIEYPNTYYFNTARDKEPLFEDWVVLLMKQDLIWRDKSLYCPCNAAQMRGHYIGNTFSFLFENISLGKNISRNPNHLSCSPTDVQSELLVQGLIPLEKIHSIAVKNEEQAKREFSRMKLQKINFDKKIYIVPDFFDHPYILAQKIQQGERPYEYPYNNIPSTGENHV